MPAMGSKRKFAASLCGNDFQIKWRGSAQRTDQTHTQQLQHPLSGKKTDNSLNVHVKAFVCTGNCIEHFYRFAACFLRVARVYKSANPTIELFVQIVAIDLFLDEVDIVCAQFQTVVEDVDKQFTIFGTNRAVAA